MHLPIPRPHSIEVTDSSRFDDYADLARVLREQRGVTLVYAPSTTTISHAAPAASPAPVQVRVSAATGLPADTTTQSAQSRPGYTLGDVIAYSGATLMGGAVLSGLVSSLLAVPMLVPLLSGVTALVGMLSAIGGAMLDGRERGCAEL
jgi:hypothetical protein